MKRREFLSSVAAAGLLAGLAIDRLPADDEHAACHPTYATVHEAIDSPREEFAFLPAILVGTKSKHPDYMATVDIDPSSTTYGLPAAAQRDDQQRVVVAQHDPILRRLATAANTS